MPFITTPFTGPIDPLLHQILSSSPSHCQPRSSNPTIIFRHRKPAPTFTPRFDVREIDGAYELVGDLPGASQQDINIEFSDTHTIVIKGKTERYAESKADAESTEAVASSALPEPEAPVEAEPATETPPAQDEEEFEHVDGADSESDKDSHYRTPTVEDEDNNPNAESAASSATAAATPAPAETTPAEQTPSAPQAPQAKYWVSERAHGTFQRSFTFAKRVEQDAVTARLRNGVLTVVVPHSPKHVSRRVEIF